MSGELKFAFTANNSVTLKINALDVNKNPIDMTTYTSVKAGLVDPDSEAVVASWDTAGGKIDLFNGYITIDILAADTVDLPANQIYYLDIVTIDGAGLPVNMADDDPLISPAEVYLRKQYVTQ